MSPPLNSAIGLLCQPCDTAELRPEDAAHSTALMHTCRANAVPLLRLAWGEQAQVSALSSPTLRLIVEPDAPLRGVERDLLLLLDLAAYRTVLLVGPVPASLQTALERRCPMLLSGADVEAWTGPPVTRPRLYWSNGTIPSWQVLMALHEKSISFEASRQKTTPDAGTGSSSELLRWSPRGQTPVLLEPDGVVIHEALGILYYLERMEPTLMPGDRTAMASALSRAQETERLRQLYRPIERLALPTHQLSRVDAARALASLSELPAELNRWDAYLAAPDAGFIAGDQMSMADCALYPLLGHMVRRGLPLDKWPRIAKYLDKIGARDSARRSLPVGWEFTRGQDLFSRAKRLRGA